MRPWAVRPEIAAAARRWREALAGGVVTALGAWWMSSAGLLFWIGAAVAVLGAVVIFTGLQRAHFGHDGSGPGVVRIDEGRVLYMGPRSGGTVDLAGLSAVSLDPDGPDGAAWVLDGPEPLHVPVGALGAAALLDAFAALPGFETSRALAALRRTQGPAVTVWRTPKAPSAIEGRSGRLPPPEAL